MKKFVFLPLQLAFITLAVISAAQTTLHYQLVFGPLAGSKNAPLAPHEIHAILYAMLIAHTLLGVGTLVWTRATPYSSLRRFVIELYSALAATSIAGVYMFVATPVPFSPNFYAHVYVILVALYLLSYPVVRRVGRGCAAWATNEPPGTLEGDARAFVFSFPAVAAIVVVVSPGILAVAYKLNGDVSNFINRTRVSLNLESAGLWELVYAWPGQQFEQPMYLQFDPADATDFYTLARPGRFYRHSAGVPAQDELLLDFSQEVASVDAELGALSFALHPEFGQTGSPNAGYVYINYTRFADEQQFLRMARYDVSPMDLATRNASRTLLIDQERPANGMHNGGTVFFGPDGMLYMTVGDMGMGWAQSVDQRLSGGIFRIDVDQQGGDVSAPIKRQPESGRTAHYFIPKDNPWFGQENALEEFWALGLRNPFRASMDASTGEIWVGDVGADQFEEINRINKGNNAQWPYLEALARTTVPVPESIPGLETPPLYYYAQTALFRAVLGGVLYRDARFPEFYGKLIFADNNASFLSVLDPAQSPPQRVDLAGSRQLGQQGMTSVVTSPDGEIYVTILGAKDRNSGEVLRLVRSQQQQVALVSSRTAEAAAKSAQMKYDAYCSRCHGIDGRGMPELDVGMAMQKRPDFSSATWQQNASDQRIRDMVNKGGLEMNASRDMPAWAGLFNDMEMDALVRKLRALHKPSSQ